MIRSRIVAESFPMRIRLLSTLLVTVLLGPGISPQAAGALERYPSPGGVYLIDWRGDFSPGEQAKLRAWLDHMGGAVAGLHGSWPRERIRIAFRRRAGSGPLPFAQMLRNAPEGILFYVDPTQPPDAFVQAWTAYHEFAHLFIPYPGRADVWISEGLASYYQNILQVRAGVLTAEQAREKLIAAFRRGSDDDDDTDLSLEELSGRMMERRAFMRVYWSGTLYFLEADTALRTATDQTLDDVLRKFGRCCLQDGIEMRGRELAAEFDRLAATELFVPLYDDYAASRAMPDWRDIVATAPLDDILQGSR